MKRLLIILALSATPSCAALDDLADSPERSDRAAQLAGDTVEDVADLVGVPDPVSAGLGALITLLTTQGLAWRRRRKAASSSSAV